MSEGESTGPAERSPTEYLTHTDDQLTAHRIDFAEEFALQGTVSEDAMWGLLQASIKNQQALAELAPPHDDQRSPEVRDKIEQSLQDCAVRNMTPDLRSSLESMAEIAEMQFNKYMENPIPNPRDKTNRRTGGSLQSEANGLRYCIDTYTSAKT